MKFPSFKKSASLLSLAVIALQFVSCGGSGNGASSVWDTLPIGAQLDINMGNQQDGTPLYYQCTVVANNIGQMYFKGKSPDAEVAFSWVRSGSNAKFNTSFEYDDESYIAPGPVTVTLRTQMMLEVDLDLGEQAVNGQLPDSAYGSCNYDLTLLPAEDSALQSNRYNGTGNYQINY